jgi:hypothetical protein
MKEINDKNLFGLVLKGLVGENKKVRIIENSDEKTEGVVTGYSRGGYKVFDEIIPPGVEILNDVGSFRVVIENISQLYLIE